MTRTRLVLLSVTALLSACGTTAVDSPTSDSSSVTAPAVSPTETPAESPAADREVAGTLTVGGGIADGPGFSVQQALDAGSTTDLPTLVNGTLFRDVDGRIYLATAIADDTVPTFAEPMLLVVGLDNAGEAWDMANAELNGLEEANGVRFLRQIQLTGFLQVHEAP